jgi:hypothetical protein
MSLAKIAAVKKRHFGYGGDVDGGADQGVGGSTYGGGTGDTAGGYQGFDSIGAIGAAPPVTDAPSSGRGKPGESVMAQSEATRQDMSPADYAGLQSAMAGVLGEQYAAGLGNLGVYGALGKALGLTDKAGRAIADFQVGNIPYGSAGHGSQDSSPQNEANYGDGTRPDSAGAQPFGTGTPVQTTPAAGSTGARQYKWDGKKYVLVNLGAQANPMGYTQGQEFNMGPVTMAQGGLAAGMSQPRFVEGGGTGLSDSVPVQMDDGGQGRLGDGEFVIPADVVSGLGGGSSKAGADILYQMMERIRQQAHGHAEQVKPVNPQQVLPA